MGLFVRQYVIGKKTTKPEENIEYKKLLDRTKGLEAECEALELEKLKLQTERDAARRVAHRCRQNWFETEELAKRAHEIFNSTFAFILPGIKQWKEDFRNRYTSRDSEL